MSEVRYNKSKTYLLPLLAEVVDMDVKFFNHLVNTYIFDDMDKYPGCFFILHDFSFKNPAFTAYEHKLTDNQYFVDLIDINDQVLYIFKFPEEYTEEYLHFVNGKYSKFGEDAKKVILAYYTKIYQGNLNAVNFLLKLKQILFKEPILKKKLEEELGVKLSSDAELTDVIEVKDETFNIKEYNR